MSRRPPRVGEGRAYADVRIGGATGYVPVVPRLLSINAVTHPGGAEIGLLRLLARLDGWEATVTTPGPGRLAERAVALRGARVRVARLAVGGLAAGSGALAVTDFP